MKTIKKCSETKVLFWSAFRGEECLHYLKTSEYNPSASNLIRQGAHYQRQNGVPSPTVPLHDVHLQVSLSMLPH